MLSYLRRRWPWALVLFICSIGLLDLYQSWFGGFLHNINALPGGAIGRTLNAKIFNNFGTTGATILFAMLYFISLLFLTNFQLGHWVRALISREPPIDPNLTPEERELERRARDLQKQASKLQEQVEKAGKPGKAAAVTKPARPDLAENSGLGADLQPVPEPTVRDLSVPSARAKGKKTAEPERRVEPAEEAIIISAKEIAAASTADILGKSAPAKPVETKTPEQNLPTRNPPTRRPGIRNSPRLPSRRPRVRPRSNRS